MLDRLLGRAGKPQRAETARAAIELGMQLGATGDHANAARAFEHALAADPDNAEAHFRLGLTWRDLQRLDAAAACYRRAIELRPGYVEAHNNLGAVLLALGQPSARAAVERAIALRPVYPEAYFNLARIDLLDDRRDDALRVAAIAETQATTAGKTALVDQIRELLRDLRR